MGEDELSVAEIVTGKLGDDKVPGQVAGLILDAMRGSAPEARAGGGGQPAAPGRVYLKSVSVARLRPGSCGARCAS